MSSSNSNSRYNGGNPETWGDLVIIIPLLDQNFLNNHGEIEKLVDIWYKIKQLYHTCYI